MSKQMMVALIAAALAGSALSTDAHARGGGGFGTGQVTVIGAGHVGGLGGMHAGAGLRPAFHAGPDQRVYRAGPGDAIGNGCQASIPRGEQLYDGLGTSCY